MRSIPRGIRREVLKVVAVLNSHDILDRVLNYQYLWRRVLAKTHPFDLPEASAARPKHRLKVFEQVYLAWSRGLLLPSVPDWVYYNWNTNLGDVIPLIGALAQLAEDGLLSLFWPLFDALLLWPTPHDLILVALKKFAHSARGQECPGVRALAEKGNEKAQEILAIVAGV